MPGSKPIQSVIKALDVIEAVAEQPIGVRLKELAGQLEMHTPTLHHFLRTLVLRGWLETSGKPPSYFIGPAPLRLLRRQAVRRFDRLSANLMLELQRLYPQANITLSEPSGTEVLIHLRISPVRPGRVERNVDKTLHPYGSATPVLFQALWSDEERENFQQNHPFWESGGAEIWQSVEKFEQFLSRTRVLGYALLDLSGEGIVKLAVPVQADDGRPRAALGVSLANRRLPLAQRADLVERVVAAANRLSQLQGNLTGEAELG